MAAVAIPAYQKYKEQAKSSVIDTSIHQIKRSFSGCLTVHDFATCSTDTINGTLQSGDLDSLTQAGSTTKSCWLVIKDDHSSCVQFENNNTGQETGTSHGQPRGTPCPEIDPSLSCSSSTVTGTCPSGCPYDAGTPAVTCNAAGAYTNAGSANCGADATKLSTAAVTATCNASGVCGL